MLTPDKVTEEMLDVADAYVRSNMAFPYTHFDPRVKFCAVVNAAMDAGLVGSLERISEPIPGKSRTREFWRIRCVFAYGPGGPERQARIFDFDDIKNAREWFRTHRHEIENGQIPYSCLFRVSETMEVIDHREGGTP